MSARKADGRGKGRVPSHRGPGQSPVGAGTGPLEDAIPGKLRHPPTLTHEELRRCLARHPRDAGATRCAETGAATAWRPTFARAAARGTLRELPARSGLTRTAAVRAAGRPITAGGNWVRLFHRRSKETARQAVPSYPPSRPS